MKTSVRRGACALGLCVVATFAAWVASAQPESRVAAVAAENGGELVDRGRYLAKVAGCNDCHTAGYTMLNGEVPESEWLMGDSLGWQGPWGTTYGSNLRIYMAAMSEDDWVKVARSMRTRPPMPWFNLHAMEENDLRAIYQFVRSLGPHGEPAPAALPPGVEPSGPVVRFVEPSAAE